MTYDGTGWSLRAMTSDDRREVAATPAPEGTKVYFFGVRPPRPAMGGKPAQDGWYSASITRYPDKWYAEASTPIAAFRLALARMAVPA